MKALLKNVRGQKSGPIELELTRMDGTKVTVEATSIPVKRKGKTEVIGIARDVTERKKAEEKLRTMNEKLGVVGKLTRHDARNRLSAVTMNAFLAKQKLPSDNEALGHLKEIETACGQVEKIFDFARIYEKLGVEELVHLDVEKTFKQAAMLFSELSNIVVTNNCQGLTLLADSLLRQLFYNLIDNSLRHGEKISQIRLYYEEASKDTLKLVFEDDGIGISKREKEKIFREGYGKGSGYGLYLIRKMCEVYGWNIQETGKQGKGARFTITIPKESKDKRENYRLR
jgi:signal transduction histidine kinase